MEEHPNSKPSAKSAKGVWYVLAVVLLVIFIFGLASNKKKEDQTSMQPVPSTGSPQAPARTTTGSYKFDSLTTGASTTLPVGTVRNVSVTMDTQGNNVVAYNVIINYDPTKLTIGKITSTVNGFSVVQHERTAGYIVVDGVKSTSDKSATVFANTPILSVPVTVKSSGDTWLKLVERSGRDEAKFFSENVTPYYPAGADVTIQSQ